MIDIHCHILPNIDDGSTSVEDSIDQLKIMDQGGISDVYLTSHYFRGHYQYERSQYDENLSNLRQEAKKANLDIQLKSGFEIFVQPGIIDDIKAKSLTMGDSSYVLIESELNGLPQDFYANVYPMLRAGYKPILAHAERYVSIMRKPSKARDLINRNIYIQTNAGSLLGHYGEKVRQTAWILIENGWTHFLASDDHVRADYSAIFTAYDMITQRIDSHTADLLTKSFPASIQNQDKIPYAYVKVQRPHHRKKNLFRRIFG